MSRLHIAKFHRGTHLHPASSVNRSLTVGAEGNEVVVRIVAQSAPTTNVQEGKTGVECLPFSKVKKGISVRTLIKNGCPAANSCCATHRSSCLARWSRVPTAMRAFYEQCLWIPRAFLLTNPDLYYGLQI